jgi:hypothetical protein
MKSDCAEMKGENIIAGLLVPVWRQKMRITIAISPSELLDSDLTEEKYFTGSDGS